jgi:hypothetical protein
LERPAELAGRDVLEDEEAAALERRALERLNADRRDGGSEADLARAYNEVWYGRKPVSNKRTSLVVDPQDGRVPPLTAEGQKIVAQSRNRRGDQGAVAWTEELDSYTRCISRVMPRLPQNYNSGTQIFQAPTTWCCNTTVRPPGPARRDHLDRKIRMERGLTRPLGRERSSSHHHFTTNGSSEESRGDLHLIGASPASTKTVISFEATIDDPAMWKTVDGFLPRRKTTATRCPVCLPRGTSAWRHSRRRPPRGRAVETANNVPKR